MCQALLEPFAIRQPQLVFRVLDTFPDIPSSRPDLQIKSLTDTADSDSHSHALSARFVPSSARRHIGKGDPELWLQAGNLQRVSRQQFEREIQLWIRRDKNLDDLFQIDKTLTEWNVPEQKTIIG